jgi:hypothetical protein
MEKSAGAQPSNSGPEWKVLWASNRSYLDPRSALSNSGPWLKVLHVEPPGNGVSKRSYLDPRPAKCTDAWAPPPPRRALWIAVCVAPVQEIPW